VIGDMDMVRPLGLAGIPVVAAGWTGPETRWSRHTVDHIELPDLWREVDATVAALVQFAGRQEQRPVLFYQNDPSALLISRHRDELAEHFSFVVSDAELVEDSLDKARFTELAMRHDLPIPGTVITRGGEHTAEVNDLSFPVIVKPVLRSRTSDVWAPVAGRAKAHAAGSAGELAALLSRNEFVGFPLVVQEAIPGPEHRIVSYHAYIDDGVTRGEFTGRKIRTWPRDFGQSTAVEITSEEDVFVLGREILHKIGFTGVAKVDFKRDDDGNLLLFEINPRFSLWHHPGAVAGVNIPALVYRSLTGSAVTSHEARSGTTWCNVWNDWRAARAAGVGAAEWFRFASAANTRRAGHFDDLGSIAGAFAYLMGKKGVKLRR
jgi:predicted ATP-grasp superfamily ATP-dependent carboligase